MSANSPVPFDRVLADELERIAERRLHGRGDSVPADATAIAALPEFRLQSAAAEIKPWICAAGALEELSMEVVEYVACRRTPAGTGGGTGFFSSKWATVSESCAPDFFQ